MAEGSQFYRMAEGSQFYRIAEGSKFATPGKTETSAGLGSGTASMPLPTTRDLLEPHGISQMSRIGGTICSEDRHRTASPFYERSTSIRHGVCGYSGIASCIPEKISWLSARDPLQLEDFKGSIPKAGFFFSAANSTKNRR
jgi:hypothetical protein